MSVTKSSNSIRAFGGELTWGRTTCKRHVGSEWRRRTCVVKKEEEEEEEEEERERKKVKR